MKFKAIDSGDRIVGKLTVTEKELSLIYEGLYLLNQDENYYESIRDFAKNNMSIIEGSVVEHINDYWWPEDKKEDNK